ncbi:FliG C-terminal domain-containing protein [Bdellovibrionota bacterium FG-1]
MNVYARYKRDPQGFRNLVELLESTPLIRRQKMIDVGMQEDPEFTEKAMSFMLNFEDVMNLPDMELAEVVSTAPPRITGMAISRADDAVKKRFLKNALPKIGGDLKEYMQVEVTLREVGGAQLKLIQVTRKLEKQGYVKTKKIPLQTIDF